MKTPQKFVQGSFSINYQKYAVKQEWSFCLRSPLDLLYSTMYMKYFVCYKKAFVLHQLILTKYEMC